MATESPMQKLPGRSFIGERIAVAMRHAKKNQNEVAKAAKISRQMIGMILQGHRMPGEYLDRIAKVLDVNIYWLTDGSNAPAWSLKLCDAVLMYIIIKNITNIRKFKSIEDATMEIHNQWAKSPYGTISDFTLNFNMPTTICLWGIIRRLSSGKSVSPSDIDKDALNCLSKEMNKATKGYIEVFDSDGEESGGEAWNESKDGKDFGRIFVQHGNEHAMGVFLASHPSFIKERVEPQVVDSVEKSLDPKMHFESLPQARGLLLNIVNDSEINYLYSDLMKSTFNKAIKKIDDIILMSDSEKNRYEKRLSSMSDALKKMYRYHR